MNFADTLKSTLRAAPRPALRRPMLQALAGLLGLAALPLLSGTTSMAGQSLRVLAALAVASTLALLALRWLARREHRAPQAVRLEVLARTALSPKNGLALVEADGQRFFLAYGEGFTELLSSAPAAGHESAGGAR